MIKQFDRSLRNFRSFIGRFYIPNDRRGEPATTSHSFLNLETGFYLLLEGGGTDKLKL